MQLFELASEDLRDDEEFVLECIRGTPPAEFKERLSYLFCCEVGVSARLRVDVAFVKEVLRLTSMLQNLPGDLQDEIAKTTIAYYESQRFIANI